MDTLKFSETPITQCYNWYNNSSDSLIFAFGGAYGMLNEYTRALPGYTHHEVKDESGNVIFSGDNAEVVLYNVVPGKYTVEVTNNSCPLKTGYGTSRMISTFDLELDDSSPPGMDAVQFRNADNIPDYIINKGESLSLYMNAYDFIDKYDTLYDASYFVYQPVLDDSTKIFIKEYDQNDWQEVPSIKYFEDTIYGSYYSADLSAYTNIDSSALDIKIKLQDYSGNKSEFILTPAILVDNFVMTGINNNEFGSSNLKQSIYPNPANDKITITFNSNLKQTEAISIFHINGQQVMQQNFQNQKLIEMDISTLPKGIYLIKIQTNEGMEVRKLVKQ